MFEARQGMLLTSGQSSSPASGQGTRVEIPACAICIPLLLKCQSGGWCADPDTPAGIGSFRSVSVQVAAAVDAGLDELPRKEEVERPVQSNPDAA